MKHDNSSGLDQFKNHPNLTIIKADVRFVQPSLLQGVDTVINLASMSNDPASELIPSITRKINDLGAVSLAKKAKRNKENCNDKMFNHSH